MSPRHFEVLWAEVAVRDLEQTVDFVEKDRPMAAQRLFDSIAESARTLESMPLRGRVVPELAKFDIAIYREPIIPPHRLIYRVLTDSVLVVGVFDSKRNLEDVLLSRFLRR